MSAPSKRIVPADGWSRRSTARPERGLARSALADEAQRLALADRERSRRRRRGRSARCRPRIPTARPGSGSLRCSTSTSGTRPCACAVGASVLMVMAESLPDHRPAVRRRRRRPRCSRTVPRTAASTRRGATASGCVSPGVASRHCCDGQRAPGGERAAGRRVRRDRAALRRSRRVAGSRCRDAACCAAARPCTGGRGRR